MAAPPPDKHDRPTARIEQNEETVALTPPNPPQQQARGSCRAGHDQPNNPTWHPTLGLVPALTSVGFGVFVVVLVLALEAWLLPSLIGWTILLLGLALLLSAAVQLVLGHRGSCWAWRTLRWWIGPIGTLVDPLEMG